ncbi:MAG: hypothetical protein JXM70_21030, partial [Pirellulales bacterium]|nr:hypothetical protein [Pirellulales bacterium]
MIKLTPHITKLIGSVLLSSIVILSFPGTSQAADQDQGELLYNGIRLPEAWPPRIEKVDREPMPVPYLESPPAVIPI